MGNLDFYTHQAITKHFNTPAQEMFEKEGAHMFIPTKHKIFNRKSSRPRLGRVLSDLTPKTLFIKVKVDKLHFIRIINFYSMKDIDKKRN